MINQTCPLILTNLHFYDFKSAFPRILDSVDIGLGDVDLTNKEERSKAVGLTQRDNENLSSFLTSTVESLLTVYIKENNVQDDDLIITQKDGFITKRFLSKTDIFMELDYRGMVDYIIITPDRKKFIYVQDDKVYVRGISHRYDKLDLIYKRFSGLHFFDKKVLFSQLQNIKDCIYECEDKEFFMINLGDKTLIRTNVGDFEVSTQSSFSLSDIDKDKYFNHYFKEFMQSIYLQLY